MAVPIPSATAVGAGLASTQPQTYQDHFSISTNDPFHGEYRMVYDLFKTDSTSTPAQIRQHVVNSPISTPKTFLAFVTDATRPAGCSSVALNALYAVPTALGATSVWDGRTFACMGDVLEGVVSSVEIDESHFSFVNNNQAVAVPGTLDRVDELLAADANAQLLGPLSANVEVNPPPLNMTTRRVMYVPPKYVPIIVNRRLTPRQAWEELVGAIRTDQKTTMCAELVNFVAIALMRTAANGVKQQSLRNSDPRVCRCSG